MEDNIRAEAIGQCIILKMNPNPRTVPKIIPRL